MSTLKIFNPANGQLITELPADDAASVAAKAAAAVDEWKEDSGVVDLKVPAAEPEVTKPVLGAAPSAPTSVPPSAAAAGCCRGRWTPASRSNWLR